MLRTIRKVRKPICFDFLEETKRNHFLGNSLSFARKNYGIFFFLRFPLVPITEGNVPTQIASANHFSLGELENNQFRDNSLENLMEKYFFIFEIYALTYLKKKITLLTKENHRIFFRNWLS